MGFYLAFTGLAGLCAFVSILAVHCGWTHPVAIPRSKAIDPEDTQQLRDCQRDLERLLADLHDKTFSLQARALKFHTDPSTEWRNWSAAWRHRWTVVGQRCRLSDASGRKDSKEIARMEPIHTALAELQLSYSEVVNRFVERYVDRLRQLRTELSTIRLMIERRRRPHPNDQHSRLFETSRQSRVPGNRRRAAAAVNQQAHAGITLNSVNGAMT